MTQCLNVAMPATSEGWPLRRGVQGTQGRCPLSYLFTVTYKNLTFFRLFSFSLKLCYNGDFGFPGYPGNADNVYTGDMILKSLTSQLHCIIRLKR